MTIKIGYFQTVKKKQKISDLEKKDWINLNLQTKMMKIYGFLKKKEMMKKNSCKQILLNKNINIIRKESLIHMMYFNNLKIVMLNLKIIISKKFLKHSFKVQMNLKMIKIVNH